MNVPALFKTAAILTYYQGKGLWARRKERVPASLQAAFRKVKTEGVAVVKGFLSPETCADLREEIDSLIQAYKSDIVIDPHEADHRIYGAEWISEKVRFFHDHLELAQFVRAFHQAPATNAFTMANRIKPKPQNLGSGGGWHRDTVHFGEIKSIVYLNDVGPANGPFQYVKHSFGNDSVFGSIWKENFPFRKDRFSAQEVERFLQQFNKEITDLTGSAGDLILTNTKGLHRGKPIQEGVRYALTNYYFPDHIMPLEKVDAYFGKNYVVPRPASA